MIAMIAASKFAVAQAGVESAQFAANDDAPHPWHNRLLAALPDELKERLFSHLQLVRLTVGEVLYECGDKLRHVYFPTDSIVSLQNVMEDGISTEIAAVGNEGMLGVALVMGGEYTPGRAVVLSGGSAYRLTGVRLRDEFIAHEQAQKLLMRYMQALFTQITQNAVCNRRHLVEQQLCRWLLVSLDRQNSNRLAVTHECLGNLLGVRRESVTAIAGKLQKLGVIHYCRGQIEVLDRARLQHHCCECYALVKKETDRLLPPQNYAPRASRETPAPVVRRIGMPVAALAC